MTADKRLKERMAMLGIDLAESQYEQFDTYYHLVIEKNKVMNLTAITAYDDFIDKHFSDSLAIVKCADLKQIQTVIDVGTGAGFPGIPIKIAYPHLKMTLLDSLNKRIKFISESVDALGLKDISPIHGRAEDFAHQAAYREQFDLCVSRAVANLATLTEYCLPFVKVGGLFIAYKSGDTDEELKQSERAVNILGGKVDKVVPFVLPGTDIERTLIMIRKVKATGHKYPRKAGVPSKEPI